jgi:hypothetical protein
MTDTAAGQRFGSIRTDCTETDDGYMGSAEFLLIRLTDEPGSP